MYLKLCRTLTMLLNFLVFTKIGYTFRVYKEKAGYALIIVCFRGLRLDTIQVII